MLVFIRGTLEQLGFLIEWISKEKLVVAKKSGTVIRLQANSTTATIDGKNVTLNSPAKIINGSVFVLLRFISQVTGIEGGMGSCYKKSDD